MNDYMQDFKDDMDNYTAKWEKALEDGVFDNADGEIPSLNQQTSKDSFFGFSNTNPTSEPAASDSEYWNAINSASEDHASSPHPLNEVMAEAAWEGTPIPQDLPQAVRGEGHKQSPSNPQARDSMGMDQELKKQSLGMTYTQEELSKLAEIKTTLYDLEAKMLTSLGMGDDKGASKVSAQIQKVKKEMNELSDEIGRAYANPTEPEDGTGPHSSDNPMVTQPKQLKNI